MIKFYLPLLYTLETRYARHSIRGLLLFLVIYLIPQFLLMFFFANLRNLGIWILAIVYVIDLYEIGYIQNDAETIKKENNPTLRLFPKELKFYEKYKISIYSFRILIAILLSYFFLFLSSYSGYIIGCVAVLWLLLPIYCLYNSIRSIWNFPLLTILTSYRFIMPLALCLLNVHLGLFLYAYFIYPFPTILQQMIMGKFGVEFSILKRFMFSNYSERFLFRVKYYMLAIFLLIIVSSIYKFSYVFFIFPLYFWVIRLILLFLQKYNNSLGSNNDYKT